MILEGIHVMYNQSVDVKLAMVRVLPGCLANSSMNNKIYWRRVSRFLSS